MKKFMYIIVCLMLFSCGNKRNNNETTNKLPLSKSIEKDDVFKVYLEIKVLDDDKFQLFYIDDYPEGSYKVNKRIVAPIKGDNDFQVVEFDLPAKVLPYKFRIDVGEMGQETLIEIKNVKLKLNGNVIEFDNTVFDRFFQPNIYLKKVQNGYIRTKVDGRCDPFFVSKALLIKKIELEL